MATMTGVIFLGIFLLAPQRGAAALAARRRRQRLKFAEAMLAIHLLHHESRPEAAEENRAEHLAQHIRWPPAFAAEVVRRAAGKGLIAGESGLLRLTDRGRLVAQEVMVR